MSSLPFYLLGTGKNIITTDHIEEFKSLNPELSERLIKHTIELRVLELSHFESFTAWILSQQISGRVAEVFLNRLREKIGTITPDAVYSLSDDVYRQIGLSQTKIEYLRNLSIFFNDQSNIIDHSEFNTNQIRTHYTKIRGIGPWSVNMFLIFNLGRLDVKAPNDLVVRKGMQVLYNLSEVPSVRQAEKYMEKWGNLGTLGCILSWAVMGE